MNWVIEPAVPLPIFFQRLKGWSARAKEDIRRASLNVETRRAFCSRESLNNFANGVVGVQLNGCTRFVDWALRVLPWGDARSRLVSILLNKFDSAYLAVLLGIEARRIRNGAYEVVGLKEDPLVSWEFVAQVPDLISKADEYVDYVASYFVPTGA